MTGRCLAITVVADFVLNEGIDGVLDSITQYFTGYENVFAIPAEAIEERADGAVYPYYPSVEQVRVRLGQAGLAIEKEGTGNWYQHFVVSKKARHTISAAARRRNQIPPAASS